MYIGRMTIPVEVKANRETDPPMSPRTAFWKWAALGALAAAILLFAQAQAVGGASGLLQTGEASRLRVVITDELGGVPLAPGSGHDGQIYYAVGADLDGSEVPELLDHAAFRYRRILYPALASGFGTLGGEALLWGMIILTVASTAVASGTVARISCRRGRPDWLALSVLLNPGVWLSVRLLTADVFALALMVLGLAALYRSPRWSMAAFVASVLAKDVYLATPAGVALSRLRRRWLLAAVPALALVLWMAWLTLVMGDGFTGRGNLALPFVGIIEGARNWVNLELDDVVYVGFALVSVIGGLLFAALKPIRLRWSILMWAVLGLISSNWVWDFGNNAARAFAPIAVLVALSSPQTVDGAGSLRTGDLAGS